MAKANDTLDNLVTTTINKDLVPDTHNTLALGNATQEASPLTRFWKYLAVFKIRLGSTELVEVINNNTLRLTGFGSGGIELKGKVVPRTTSLHELGTSSRSWKSVTTDKIVLKDTTVGTGTPTQDKTIAIEVNGETLYIHASTSAN